MEGATYDVPGRRRCGWTAHGTPVNLTQRECDVLALLARGAKVRHIAQTLGISLNTCRSHVKSLIAKLGASSQVDAVVRAQGLGLVGPDDQGGR